MLKINRKKFSEFKSLRDLGLQEGSIYLLLSEEGEELIVDVYPDENYRALSVECHVSARWTHIKLSVEYIVLGEIELNLVNHGQ
jgi:hypothetical protein